MSAPLRLVLEAVAAGAGSHAEVAARTGLSRDVVDAACEHLVRAGRLQRPASSACPASGCGGCPTAAACGTGPVALGMPARRAS